MFLNSTVKKDTTGGVACQTGTEPDSGLPKNILSHEGAPNAVGFSLCVCPRTQAILAGNQPLFLEVLFYSQEKIGLKLYRRNILKCQVYFGDSVTETLLKQLMYENTK